MRVARFLSVTAIFATGCSIIVDGITSGTTDVEPASGSSGNSSTSSSSGVISSSSSGTVVFRGDGSVEGTPDASMTDGPPPPMCVIPFNMPCVDNVQCVGSTPACKGGCAPLRNDANQGTCQGGCENKAGNGCNPSNSDCCVGLRCTNPFFVFSCQPCSMPGQSENSLGGCCKGVADAMTGICPR